MLATVEKPRIWTPSVSRAWQLPEKLTVSEWADRSRILGPENPEPGQWKTDRTPYLRGIMDAFNDPDVEDITIMKPTQVGGTESMLNMLGYIIDQDPGPTLYVMPREPDAKSFSAKRIVPMLQLSEDLTSHLTDNSDDVSRLEITLDRMTLYLSGANSPASLSSRPIKNVLFDETDKYPTFSGKEADPIALAAERQKNFWNRKTVKASTPTTEEGYICREYELSDKQKYYVPCPHCGKMQLLLWGQVKYPENVRDPEEILAKHLAWYECSHCKGVITDQMKPKMLRAGRWVPEKYKDYANDFEFVFPKSKRSGYWINAIYSPWVSFAEMAATWLKAQGRNELLMNFVNSWLAEPWKEKITQSSTDEVRALEQPYQMGIVPAGGMVLTGAVDVQQDHFVVSIRAWGYMQESWGVLDTLLHSWEDVEEVMIRRSYPTADGRSLQLAAVAIDTGYRANEVYEFCRKWVGLAYPIKGKDNLGGLSFRTNRIDKFSDGSSIPEGLMLYHIDTTYFKNKVARLVKNTAPDRPAGWHIHANPSEDYLKQFCAEAKKKVKDKKTGRHHEVWIKISTSAPNHYWDTEVYSTAVADIIQVYNLPKPEEVVQARQAEAVEDRKREGWVEHRSGWTRR